MPDAVPDILPGDTIRIFGGAGAHFLTGAVRDNLVIQVVAVGVWPDRPDWVQVCGRLCRNDLTVRRGTPHTQVSVTGAERSITNLSGMWQRAHRPEKTREQP
jgi:hypothetical protein